MFGTSTLSIDIIPYYNDDDYYDDDNVVMNMYTFKCTQVIQVYFVNFIAFISIT